MAFAVIVAIAAFTATSMTTTTRAEAESAPMTKEDVQNIIKDYLVQNPMVVIDAIQAYQQNERALQDQRFKETLSNLKNDLHKSDAPHAGSDDADVNIVEFFDYNCGYCIKAVDDVIKVLQDDKKVRVTFMDFPILSQSSQVAARWALAANKQGKYYDFHVALMHYHGQKDEAALTKIAQNLGLDVAQLKKDADSKDVRAQIEKNIDLARQLGINGTPGFIIGDTLNPGYMGLDNLKQAVAAARKGGEPTPEAGPESMPE